MPSNPPVFRKDTLDKELERQVRGPAFVSSILSGIKRINKLHYRVKSQSSEGECYDVVK
jgi:hypothetical protein